ncbi:MAG: histidine--tRNA ligase [Thiobacillus sp. 63-78]|uniref:histidine--tRNA ligase n=1 Tax=Thiobacillus sp. 63-78 TaxID=1895859 RepID=UPI0009648133|nr:histidine--tRNA ligase [Thiobacillus sp. 63-78]MBN8762523.1 histidine--tRNA ligase [Thiobacillus sp.]MBN8773654.1 histidine--tRNA ligase [Thiobacillus sp.]OJZ11783.1 MAG: histidine--tRNA ligase [Thiobacillus sp. 63-78]
MSNNNIQSVRGMNDLLPDATDTWQGFEAIVRDWLRRYGYREMRTPILEHTGLFKRAIGEVTDIVEKEMYTFIDELNGESLTLRPEGTASSVRAVIQHNLLYDGGKRLWYSGPMFRHERPQKGRYRQFHQVGVEALGFAGPDTDAELIVMCADLWKELDIAPTLQLNTLGDQAARQRHRQKLVAYFESHREVLDEDAKRRLHSNPLRILDSKNPAMQALNEAAPRLMDELEDEALTHFDDVQSLLRAHGIAFEINPRLVRGLDYYNRTVFEWVTDQLGAQGTVCAGGRYDGLIEQLGGKPAPAAGFAMGMERLLALVEAGGRALATPGPDAYIVHAGDTARVFAWQVASALRSAGLSTILHCGGGGFKSQMKKADASCARYAVIVGDDEAAARQVTLKPLRDATEQRRTGMAQAIQFIQEATTQKV